MVVTMTAKDQILNFLSRNIRYSYNAPTIYRRMKGKIPISTIRQSLKRLYTENKILKIDRGFYQAKVNDTVLKLLERPPTLLHAITISCECPKLQKRGEGAKRDSDKNIVDWLEFNKFRFSSYNKNSGVGQWDKRIWFDENRDVVVTVHLSTGVVTFTFGCSKHPVNYIEFRDMLSNVEGRMSFLTPFCNQLVTAIGINKDYKELDLYGVSCLRLKEYENAWFQIYKKESIGVTRIESHLAPKLGLKEAFLIIESLSSRGFDGSDFDDKGGMFR